MRSVRKRSQLGHGQPSDASPSSSVAVDESKGKARGNVRFLFQSFVLVGSVLLLAIVYWSVVSRRAPLSLNTPLISQSPEGWTIPLERAYASLGIDSPTSAEKHVLMDTPTPNQCGVRWSRLFPTWLQENKRRAASNPRSLLFWTMSGGDEYRLYLPVLLARWRSLGMFPVTVIALDEETARTVCDLGYFSIQWDLEATSYSMVADVKFGMSALLAENGIPSWFLELDVFCRKSPLPLFPTNYDVVHLAHGDYPSYPNIGSLLVQPSPHVATFFRNLGKVLAKSKQNRTYWTENGKRKKFFDQNVYFHCLPPTGPEVGGRLDTKYYVDDNKKVELLEWCRNNQTDFQYRGLSPVDINSLNPPSVYDETSCVHPLATEPFSPLQFKVANAMFQGFDPRPMLPSDRYLRAYGGDLSTNECWLLTFFRENFATNEGGKSRFQRHVASLVALALESNRTLMLPRHFRDKTSWIVPIPVAVDVRSIEQVVPYRFVMQQEYRSLPFETKRIVAQETYSQTKEAILKSRDTPIVAVDLSCKMIPDTTKVVSDMVERLNWCLRDPTQLVFVKSIGSYGRFCGS